MLLQQKNMERHGCGTRQLELIVTDMMSGMSCTDTTIGWGQKSCLSMHEDGASSSGLHGSLSCRKSPSPGSREGLGHRWELQRRQASEEFEVS
jgi:hypothetical protein